MSTLSEIVSRLDARKSGNGWAAKCPAHDDKNPSLSIHEGENGAILLNCHVGCTIDSICGALGITKADLFPKKQEGRKKETVAIYDYTDESGALLYQVCREIPKNFPQRRPDGKGGWLYNLSGVRRVLFRLPEITEAIASGFTILIAEGEKDALKLVEKGFHATCNSGGACAKKQGDGKFTPDCAKWLDDYCETLRGANVVIVPDNDDPGRAHADAVASRLLGVAASTKTITLPLGKDAHDFFTLGGTVDQLNELITKTPIDSPPKTFVEIVRERRFNPLTKPPMIQPVFSALGIPFATRGNLQAISALSKAGKSGWINAMLAAPMATAGSDCLGIESDNPDSFAALHFDTEQSIEDHWSQVGRAIRRAGRQTLPEWIRSYCFTGFTARENQDAIWLEVEQAAREFGGIHSILIDGVADLVNNVNDPEECNPFVARLHALAIKYACPITGVIHINPGSEFGKTRGHLGSQLERKSESNLRIDKDGEVSEVWSEKQRRAPILKGHGPRFQWSNEAHMHVTIQPGQSQKEIDRREAAIELRDQVFSGRPSMRRHEIEKALGVVAGHKQRTACREVSEWARLGVIRKEALGLWTTVS